MPLLDAYMTKTVEGNTQFSLSADEDESYLIQDVQIYSPSADYVTFEVNRTIVGYWRVGGTLGNHLPFRSTDYDRPTLMRKLIDEGIFRPIPVPTGKTFKITGAHDANSIVTVIYERYDKNDILDTMPNGEKSNDFDVMQYGRYSTTLVDGYNQYETQQTDDGYPAFPFGEAVPPKTIVTLYGIAASDVGKRSGTGANGQVSDRIRLTHDRKVLTDDARLGMLNNAAVPGSDTTTIGAGQSLFGNFSDVDYRPILMFPQPFVFDEGDILKVEYGTTLVSGSANLAVTDAEIACILRMERT